MNDIQWNKIILAEFTALACLTPEENTVLLDWISGKSVVQTHMERNMSTRRVDTLRHQIRQKYDAVQPFSPLLPKRAKK